MTATIALPRPDWLARLRTIMALRGGRRVVNIPGGAVSVSRRAVSSGATDWWLAGGAPTPVAVYQPKGAASLSASYTNLVNPGTYNAAPGVAPTWDAATGWTFNGTTQYLTTSVIPTGAYSALARFSNSGGVNARWLFGTSNTAVTSFFGIQPNRLNALGMFNGNTSRTHGSSMLSGVVAIAGVNGYRDGELVITNLDGNVTDPARGIQISGYITTGGFLAFNMQAMAIWNTSTDNATWMPAVSAAVAAL